MVRSRHLVDNANMTTGAPAQTVHFDQKHYTAVVSGAKVSTVRWREDIHEGPAIFIFDNHPTARPLTGQVTAVETYDLAHLSPLAARQPPGTDMTNFARQLRVNYYPEMPEDAVVQVVVIATGHHGDSSLPTT
ncbi:hypothetical protein RER_06110 [Rhodococcus erythropolis PR4]|uniref:ASCH domain-containing protein n=2 Tax=Rhodococcus erythropolis TaxID=1833 RepID=C0ZNR7_RHOE4|nr:hypothetical protein RER_06110 [Rhodococcus erythropolis PR4]